VLQEERQQMESAIKRWVECWSSGKAVAPLLQGVLDPAAHVHDGYGLHQSNSGGEEGGVKFDFSNREEAEKAVKKVHEEFENVQVSGWPVPPGT
jgi:hypothetical protein